MKRNPKILLLVGAPGSGKSTFARYFIRTEENWMRLCRDDFRMMHFTHSNLPDREEQMITEMMDASVEALLLKNCNVVVDATHCRAEYLNHYVKKFNDIADISFKLFDVAVDELAERCEKRKKETGKGISERVLKGFVKDFENLKKTFDFSPRPAIREQSPIALQDAALPKAIICDLDGTLALMGNRDPYDATHSDEDAINAPVANVLKALAKEEYCVLLVSGREERFREPTLRFLDKYEIPYSHLWMRPTKDFRKDAVIKREIFEREIAGKFFIDFVLDDRDQVVDMWRKDMKFNCFQVNYGKF
jgi:predicted kinase